MKPAGLLLAAVLAVIPTAVLPAAEVAPWPRAEVRYVLDHGVSLGLRQAWSEAVGLWTKSCPWLKFTEVADTGWERMLWNLGLDRVLLVRVDPELRAFGRTTRGWGARAELVFRPELSPGDWLVPDLAHEIGHVLGLGHEHQRRDRDQYVAFPVGFLDSLPADRAADYALDLSDPPPGNPRPYDAASIMQYSANIDGSRMVRRDTGALVAGVREPSAGDRRQLELLYHQPAPSQELPR